MTELEKLLRDSLVVLNRQHAAQLERLAEQQRQQAEQLTQLAERVEQLTQLLQQ